MPTLLEALGHQEKSLKAIREDHQSLLDEAVGIEKVCRDEERAPSADESKRFDQIMKVELPAADRALAIAEAKSDQRAREAIGRREGREQQAGENDTLLLRDQSTGAIIPTLGPQDSLTAYVASRGESMRASSSREINDSHDTPLGESDWSIESLPQPGEIAKALALGTRLPDGRTVQNALGTIDTEGGFMIPDSYGAMFIDVARPLSAILNNGARMVPMTTRVMHLIRADSDPSAQWRPEGVDVKASSPSFGQINLEAKTLACVTPIPIEHLEDSANAASLIQELMASKMALQLDQAALRGSGAESEPLGIINNAGVNLVDSVGTPANYAKVSEAVGKIMRANYPGAVDDLTWIQSPRDAETYDQLVATDGQPLQPTPWAAALRRAATTSLPTDLGAGSNESESVVGDFSQCLVGMRTTGINIRVLDAGEIDDVDGFTHNAASQLKKLIVCYMRADVALLRPSWFTVLDGITAA